MNKKDIGDLKYRGGGEYSTDSRYLKDMESAAKKREELNEEQQNSKFNLKYGDSSLGQIGGTAIEGTKRAMTNLKETLGKLKTK